MRVVFLILCSLIILAGCKKNSGESEISFFKMKVNGVQKNYDSCWISGFQQAAGVQTYYQVNILCGKPGDYAGASVNDVAPIKAGNYISANSNPASNTPMAGLGAYRPAGSSNIYISYQGAWPIYNINVTITEYNADYVTGTFSGKLRLLGGTEVLDVTEGEFRALR